MEKEINNKIYFLSALTFFFGTITLFYYGLISGWNYRFILNQEFYLTGLQSQLGFFIDVLNCFFALLLSLLFFTYWIIFKDKRDQSLKSDLIFFLLALFVLFSDNLLFPLVGFLFIFSFFIEKQKVLLPDVFSFLSYVGWSLLAGGVFIIYQEQGTIGFTELQKLKIQNVTSLPLLFVFLGLILMGERGISTLFIQKNKKNFLRKGSVRTLGLFVVLVYFLMRMSWSLGAPLVWQSIIFIAGFALMIIFSVKSLESRSLQQFTTEVIFFHTGYVLMAIGMNQLELALTHFLGTLTVIAGVFFLLQKDFQKKISPKNIQISLIIVGGGIFGAPLFAGTSVHEIIWESYNFSKWGVLFWLFSLLSFLLIAFSFTKNAILYFRERSDVGSQPFFSILSLLFLIVIQGVLFSWVHWGGLWFEHWSFILPENLFSIQKHASNDNIMHFFSIFVTLLCPSLIAFAIYWSFKENKTVWIQKVYSYSRCQSFIHLTLLKKAIQFRRLLLRFLENIERLIEDGVFKELFSLQSRFFLGLEHNLTKMQSGNIQNYLFVFAVSFMAIFIFIVVQVR